MKTKRLNLSEFKVKAACNKNENDVSKLMGAVLGDCHDGPSGLELLSPRPTGPEVIIEDNDKPGPR